MSDTLPMGRKFSAMLVGSFVVLVAALSGKMDGNLSLCISVIIGGFYGSNAVISKAAITEGLADPPQDNAG